MDIRITRGKKVDKSNKKTLYGIAIGIPIGMAIIAALALMPIGDSQKDPFYVDACESLPSYERDRCYSSEALYRNDTGYCGKIFMPLLNSYCISSVTNRYSGDAGFPG
ncbi:MAG: hypothetical protein HYW24_02800 [Candidatus Aenigmarchaeota archaeon]|nr:hypothetical protein [Candidatus Aenigmarchaeota archaeon]